MAGSVSLCKTDIKNEMNDSDLVAVEQLMQLSDEDSQQNNNNINKENKPIVNFDEEVNQLMKSKKKKNVLTSLKIEEIFGKEEDDQDEIISKPKKRKYRSLAEIYRTTVPISNVLDFGNQKLR